MNLKTAIIATLVATAATASFAQGNAANTQFGDLSPSIAFDNGSAASREQVRQSALSAQAAGQIAIGDLQRTAERADSVRSRDDVKAELRAARAAGELPPVGEGVSALNLKARQPVRSQRTDVATN